MKRPPLPDPANNLQVAEAEFRLERAWGREPNEEQAKMLQEIQALIERIKLDTKTITLMEGSD